MVEVAVRMRVGLPLPNTDSTFPVTRRKAVTSPDLSGGFSITMRLPPRRRNASSATAKMISPFDAVSTVSPGLMRVWSVAGWLLTLTVPETR